MSVDYSQPAKPPNWDKRIREIHPRLETRWNAPRRRWEIWYDADMGRGPRLAIVVGDGKTYRPLDERILQTLRAGDTHRVGPRAVCEIMDAEEEAYFKMKQAELDSMTEAAAREMADHSRLVQKPIGVTTEKEMKRK
jgi:hypothetical protein